MKFHWGNILVLAFIAFGGMIILLVVKSINSNYDMVSKEYYKEELVFQRIIDATNRTIALNDSIRYHHDNKQMIITLPPELSSNNINADVHFYCAYDAKKDQKLKTNFKEGMSSPISLIDIDAGIYTLKLKFTADGKEFYQEKDITIHSK